MPSSPTRNGSRRPFTVTSTGCKAWPTGTTPWCRSYACDNDVYPHRDDAGWWKREGENAWLKMLDKVPSARPPLWALLPDVAADWERTLERAELYRDELRSRRLRVALTLQDGCDFEQALHPAPDVVFVGGSTAWKWGNVERVCRFFLPLSVDVHVGRVNTAHRVRACKRLSATSCDGTGASRYRDEMLPLILRELDRPQLQREFDFSSELTPCEEAGA